MASFGTSKQILIINPYDIPKLDNYRIWKLTRRELIKDFEDSVIEISDHELKKVFNEWTGALILRLQSGVKSAQMASLLTISILFHFQKMAEDISNYLKRIEILLESDDIEVCRAAGKTLRWFAEDYDDNQVFLQETLELANKWLESDKRNEKLFNAFEILYEVGRFQPSNVLAIFARHFDVIIPSVSSTNPDLSKVAKKTIITHIRQVSIDVGDSFAGTIYFDCICALKNPKCPSVCNFLQILKTIYKEYISVVDPLMVVGLVINTLNHTQIDTLKCAVSFLKLISEKTPKVFQPSHGDKIITALQTQITKHQNDLEIFPLIKIIAACLPLDVIPYIILVNSLLMIIDNKQLAFQHESAYEILQIIFARTPKDAFSIDTFYGREPNIGLLKLVTLINDHSKLMTPFFIDWVNKGFTYGATTRSVMISLTVLQYFRDFIPMQDDYLTEEIERFIVHPDIEVRCRAADALSSFSSARAILTLINLAINDISKGVRIYSMKLLRAEHICSHIQLFSQLINDKSAKIRNASIEILSKAAELSPAFITNPMIPAVNRYISLIISPKSPKENAKLCSSIPVIAKHFSKIIPSIIPTLIWCCVYLLNGDKEFPNFFDSFPENSLPKDSILILSDLSQVKHYDPSVSSTSELWKSIKNRSQNVLTVLSVIRKKWDEVRDLYLFEALGELSEYITPYILQVIPVFSDSLNSKRNLSIHKVAVKNLTKIVKVFNKFGNFRCLFPELTLLLTNLMIREANHEFSGEILKLIGNIGFSNLENKITKNFTPRKFDEDFSHKYLIDIIFKMFNKPSETLMATLVSLVAKEKNLILRFLDKILHLFVDSLYVLESIGAVFMQLDIVCYYCGEEITPYLFIIKDLLKENMSNNFCVKVCTTLSMKLKSEFNEYAKLLYLESLKNIKTTERILFKAIIKFATSVIINQNMNERLFIESIEDRLNSKNLQNDNRFVFVIFKAFSRLAQYSKSKLFMPRMAQIVFKLQPQITQQLLDLLTNLCLFGGVSIPIVLHYIKFDKKLADQLKIVENMLNTKKWTIKETNIIKDLELTFDDKYYEKVVPLLTQTKKFVLLSLKEPIHYNNQKWMNDVAILVMQNSPSETIRSCSSLIISSNNAVKALFPIAFTTYWIVSSTEEKNFFSKMVLNLLKSKSIIDPAIFSLIKLLEFIGLPLSIDDSIISESKASEPLMRFYLQRQIKSNPNNFDAIKKLFNLDVKMSLHDSSRAIGDIIIKSKNSEAGIVYESLNEWEKALEFYKNYKNYNQDFLIMKCLAKLERYDELLNYEDKFNSLNAENKSLLSLAFAKANFYLGDKNKIQHFLSFAIYQNFPEMIFNRASFYVEIGNYEEAQKMIDNCFFTIAQGQTSMNNHEFIENLKISQLLIELEDIINEKLNNTTPKNKTLDTDAPLSMWISLFDIRNISHKSNINLCKNLISAMRRKCDSRYSSLIEKRISLYRIHPDIAKAALKLKWEEGKRSEALTMISKIISFIESENLSELKHFMQEKLLSNKSIDEENIIKGFADKKYQSDIYRMKSYWLLYDKNNLETVTNIINLSRKSFDLSNSLKAAESLVMGFYKYKNLTRDQIFVPEEIKTIKYVLNIKYQIFPIIELFNIIKNFPEFFEKPQIPFKWIRPVQFLFFTFLNNENQKSHEIFFKLLQENMNDHINEMLYDIQYYSNINERKKKEIKQLHTEKNSNLFHTLNLFSKGIKKALSTVPERMLRMIISKWIPSVMENTTEVLVEIRSFLKTMKDEVSALDNAFLIALDDDIKVFIESLNKFVSEGSTKPNIILDSLKELQIQLEKEINSIGALQLNSVSPILSENDFSLLPVLSNSFTNEKISKIDQIVNAHPDRILSRSISLLTNEGVAYRYLVQPTDQSIDRKLTYCIKTFSRYRKFANISNMTTIDIISLSKEVSLMKIPENFQSIKKFITLYREAKLPKVKSEEQTVYEHTSLKYDVLTKLQRLEVFDTVIKNKPESFHLRDAMWYLSYTPQQWLDTITTFSNSFALESTICYMFGIRNRNPRDILIEPSTGRVLPIDLYHILEKDVVDIPFRLTPLFENALDDVNSRGVFSAKVGNFMKIVFTNSQRIIDFISVYDGIIEEQILSQAFSRAKQDVSRCEEITNELISRSRNPSYFTQMNNSWFPLW